MIESAADRPSTARFAAFIQSAWGAFWGLWLAALVVSILVRFPPAPEMVHEDVLQYGGDSERYLVPLGEKLEQLWFVLAVLLAPLLAMGALLLPWRLPLVPTLLASAAACPLLTEIQRATFFSGRLSKTWFILTALALLAPLLWRRSTAGAAPNPVEKPPPEFTWRPLPTLLGMALVLGACFLLVFPRSLPDTADALAAELHIGSFLLSPSLYYRQAGLIPGLDFESHYGIGPSYLFSFFLGDDLHGTMVYYLVFFLSVLVLYYLGAFLVLTDLFRSYRAGLVGFFALLFWSLEGNHYLWPSNWPIRYPLLFPFVWLAARETLWGRPWAAVLAAGVCAGLSLFWQTDVGLYLLIGGTMSYLARALFGGRAWSHAPCFLAASVGSFLLLNFLLFGPRVLAPEFCMRLLEPLTLYSGGFGAYPMFWTHGWRYVYNVLGTLTACATIGWAALRFWAHRGQPLPADARALLLCSGLGLLMIYKWANRSIDAVWSYNAPLLVTACLYWGRAAVFSLEEALSARRQGIPLGLPGKRLLQGSLALLFLGLAISASKLDAADDYASPLVRLQKYYLGLPTWMSSLAGKDAPPAAPPVQAADVDLIRKHTGPADRVAIISPNDWLYLTEAARVPHFHYVHVVHTHSSVLLHRLLADLDRADLVFLDRAFLPRFAAFNPAAHRAILPRLNAGFTEVDASPGLVLLRRKPG